MTKPGFIARQQRYGRNSNSGSGLKWSRVAHQINLKEALMNSSLNHQSTPKKKVLEKMSFLFCFIFNDLQSLKMAAHLYVAEALNNQSFLRFQEIPNMPIYEYRATKESNCSYCKAGFDRLQRLSDSPITSCPQCRQPVRRVISAPNLGKADTSLARGNLEKHGFTRYEKAEKGVYEKTAGKGPHILKDK